MTLRQLRLFHEIAKNTFSISAAAAALNTSQPGVSRQVGLLERELGFKLLIRRKNKILGLTEGGRDILEVADRLLNEAENIRLISAELRGELGGRLVVATSHLHARYMLIQPATAFSEKHANVELHLVQADPESISRLVETGAADIGISTKLPSKDSPLLLLPSQLIRRSVIMPKGHPLAIKKRLSLADLAPYPLVGYHADSIAGSLVRDAFRKAGLDIRLVVSANDSDVIKTYVGQGFGIAVVPSLAIDESDRATIRSVDATSLFPETFMTISLRRNRHLNRYLSDFIELIAPEWTRERCTQKRNECTSPN